MLVCKECKSANIKQLFEVWINPNTYYKETEDIELGAFETFTYECEDCTFDEVEELEDV